MDQCGASTHPTHDVGAGAVTPDPLPGPESQSTVNLILGTIIIPEIAAAPPRHQTVTRLAALMAPAAELQNYITAVPGIINYMEVDEVLAKAWAFGQQPRGPAQAVLWATDEKGVQFSFSETIKFQDGIKLTALGNDLDALIDWKRQQLWDKGHMSRDSVERALSERTVAHLRQPKDAERLRSLVEGIRIPTTPNFIPRTLPEPLRKSYLAAKPAVQKLLNGQAVDGTIIILLTSQLLGAIRMYDLHNQSFGWAKKSDNDSGRVTGDMSYSKGGTSLNGTTAEEKEFVRRQAKQMYGRIVMPTLESIVINILSVADRYGWARIVLFKKDVAKAFNQLLFDKKSVTLTGFALDEQFSCLHIVANFGASVTPPAWEVVGRVLDAVIEPDIETPVDRYVDDLFGACMEELLAYNNSTIDKAIVDLLGKGALAPHKDKHGRQLVILGWLFDLDKRTVSLSETNMLKSLYAFMVIPKATIPVSLQDLERAASLASRCAKLHRAMKSFTVALYKAIPTFKGNREARHTLSNNAYVDIAMWKAFLPLMAVAPESYARPLESFRPAKAPSVNFGTDGSLGGVGLGLTALPSRRVLAHAGVFPLPCLRTTDSSFQNTFELMAIILALLIAIAMGLHNFSYSATGDSKVTLSWLRKDRVSSLMGRRAAIAFALLSATAGATCTMQFFLLSEDNSLWDAKSRGEETEETRALPENARVNCPPGSPAHRLLSLLDPQLPDMNTNETLTFIEHISSIIAEVRAAGRVDLVPQSK